jgi:integrase
VFQPLTQDALPYSPTRDSIGPVISAIGEKAGIIVGTRAKVNDEGEPETVSKFASAHDLRRAFGFRWSRRVKPRGLKELMRHTDISPTMRFYVGLNAQATADELWRAEGNILGSSGSETATAESEQST